MERPPTLVNQNVSAGIVTSCASSESLKDVSRLSGPGPARPTGATNSSAGCVASLAESASTLPSRVIAGPPRWRSPVVIWRTEPPRAVGHAEHVELRSDLVPHLARVGRVLHEHDRPAVGRPVRSALAQVAARELLRLAASRWHEVQVAGAPGLARRHEPALVLHER